MESMDRTRIARDRRYKARQRGENVPFRKPGRPAYGESPLIESASLDQLLAAAYKILDRMLPDELETTPVYWPGLVEYWNILVGIEKLQLALNASADR